MNLTSAIGKNCRTILREHFSQQRSPNQMNTWKACYPIPTNPIHSLYGVDHLQVPLVFCEKPSYCNTLLGLSPKIPWMNSIRDRNRQSNCAAYLSKPSESCIQTITNCIIHKIRCQIPPDEMSLLCCCLPSLIRQMMCNSPWLTPNDIVQWLSADILKESMNCVDRTDPNFSQPSDHRIRRGSQQREENTFEDHHSIQAEDDDHHANLPSHSSRRGATTTESTKSNLNLPGSKTTQKKQSQGSKTNHSRTPSTRSFTSQRSHNLPSDTHPSNMSPTWDDDNQSHRSEHNPPGHSDEDARSFTSFDQGIDKFNTTENTPIDSMENFDRKSASRTPQSGSIHPSSRTHLEYPGKKDPNAIRDVEKCLAFYQQMREHFDDDIAAMLLKCCLCYGDCSGKK